MQIEQLGFTDKAGKIIGLTEVEKEKLARVIVEHRERYIVQTINGTFQAEILGNLRYTARGREDFPAVGDWVEITMMDEDSAIILQVLPRYSVLQRQAVGKTGEVQIIATNIDYAFIVQAVGHDFNLKRLERYLSICFSSDIEPLVLLSKVDLIPVEETQALLQQISERAKDVKVIAVSSENMQGFEALQNEMQAFRTYCFLGSSGVGKSTIVNLLLGGQVLKTNEISSSTNKGRHTTSHRELLLLPNGSIVIDTPGMRELGMTDQLEGIEETYDEIVELAAACKYADCSHTDEAGCAVIDAVEQGELSEEVYLNYLKLMKEYMHFSSTALEKRKKDKEFGKMVKQVMKEKKGHKFS